MSKNQHDLLFRKTLSDTTMFRAFCEAHLPPLLKKHLQLDQLKLCKLSTQFIRKHHSPTSVQSNQSIPKLKENIADIIYSAKLKHSQEEALIILLAEHQSTPDPYYPLRNALYVLSVLQDYTKQYQQATLPVPISLLYYQGKISPYPYSLELLSLFNDNTLATQYFLKPILIDLGQHPDTKLMNQGPISGMDIALKHTYTPHVSKEGIDALMQAFTHCKDRNLKEIWYTYTIEFWDADPTPIIDRYQQTQTAGEVFTMTVADYFRQQGREQGLEQGIEQGLKKGIQQERDRKAKEIALELLKQNQELEWVAHCVKLPVAEVAALRDTLILTS